MENTNKILKNQISVLKAEIERLNTKRAKQTFQERLEDTHKKESLNKEIYKLQNLISLMEETVYPKPL
tara:strand:- start:1375 stop:1578 length:204 start_codon:yes stop_codon:yes gene_type:complete